MCALSRGPFSRQAASQANAESSKPTEAQALHTNAWQRGLRQGAFLASTEREPQQGPQRERFMRGRYLGRRIHGIVFRSMHTQPCPMRQVVPPPALRDTIAVRNLNVRLLVGPDAWGRERPQPVYIDAKIRTDVSRAGQTDEVGDSHNYGTLYRALEALSTPSASFANMAHLAEVCARTCIESCHAPWADIEVRLPRSQLRAAYASVILTRTPHALAHPSSEDAQALCAADHTHLHDIDMFVILGVNPWERETKQRIAMHIDMWPLIASTSALQAMVQEVCTYVESTSFLTIETLVTQVAERLLVPHALDQVRVRVDKPSAILHADASSVEIVRDRSFFVEEAPSTTKEHTAILAIGTNLGDRMAHIQAALTKLEAHPAIHVVDTSFLYETTPMYYTDQPRFLNGACKITTSLLPMDLLDVCQRIEIDVGRTKVGVPRNGPRVIDLDILLYDREVIDEGERLQVPHPRLAERAFVLHPLCDLCPDYVHPVLQAKISALAPRATTDMTRVTAMGPALWHWGTKTFVMGILNATPDSFSDGGRHLSVEAAMTSARRMAEAGVDMFDVGGQSTAPGVVEVTSDEEAARVVPLIQALANDPATQHIPISIDTYRADVARQALDAGAHVVNDISGGTRDPAMLALVAERQCPYILMHMRGNANTMASLTTYEQGVVQGVVEELQPLVLAAMQAGIRRWNVIIDPGIGFAKDTHGNVDLLRHLPALNGPGAGHFGTANAPPFAPGDTAPSQPLASMRHMPLLLGVSRKRFLGALIQDPSAAPAQRMQATMAACAATIPTGCVDIVRIHDVVPAMDMVRTCDAIARPTPQTALATTQGPQVTIHREPHIPSC